MYLDTYESEKRFEDHLLLQMIQVSKKIAET